MSEYEGTSRIARPADAAFDYLKDVTRLPEYFPQITSVRVLDGERIETTAHVEAPGQPPQEYVGQAWFRVADDAQKVSWGSEGPNNYEGELDIDPDGDDA